MSKKKICEDCLERVSDNNICVVKSRNTDFQKELCQECAIALLRAQDKHFYCEELE